MALSRCVSLHREGGRRLVTPIGKETFDARSDVLRAALSRGPPSCTCNVRSVFMHGDCVWLELDALDAFVESPKREDSSRRGRNG